MKNKHITGLDLDSFDWCYMRLAWWLYQLAFKCVFPFVKPMHGDQPRAPCTTLPEVR